jgi:hypothetical protein
MQESSCRVSAPKDNHFLKYLKDFRINLDRYGKKPSTLHFNNPTDNFSTRCDVIYKTLLRDCRKYYTEKLNFKCVKKGSKSAQKSQTFERYIEHAFGEYSNETIAEIKFYLNWFTFPKQIMVSSCEPFLREAGEDMSQARRKIVREFHVYLYNFSMEKCEKFFSNRVLSIIFKDYILNAKSRIEESPTMQKNIEVYHSALKLILNKIDKTLS